MPPAAAPSIVETAAAPAAAAVTPAAAAPVEGSAPLEKPVRPEWAGKPFDGYWSDDAGLDTAKLTTDFEAMAALKAQTDERAKQVPENLDEYEIALPEGFAVPEGVTLTFDKMAEDPVLKQVLPDIRQFAKDNGFTKDQFKGLVALKAKLDLAEHGALKAAAAEQLKTLGTKAVQRVNSLVTFLQGKLGNEHASALMPMMFSAKQVEAFEKLAALAGATQQAPGNGGREINQPQGISEDDWAKLSPTQKINYGRKTA